MVDLARRAIASIERDLLKTARVEKNVPEELSLISELNKKEQLENVFSEPNSTPLQKEMFEVVDIIEFLLGKNIQFGCDFCYIFSRSFSSIFYFVHRFYLILILLNV